MCQPTCPHNQLAPTSPRAQTCEHSGVEPSRLAKAILQGGSKSSKKIRIFHHFENSRPYISETIENRGIYGKNVIPVLRITPRATKSSAVSVFLSVAKSGRVCRAQTCAHSGIEPSRLAKGFPQGGPKSPIKFEFLTISKIYVPISLQPL